MPSSKHLGPAHVLAEAMKALETNQPGLLDLPLPHNQAYKPKGSSTSSSSRGANNQACGLKRKGVTEETMPAMEELTNSVTPEVQARRKEQIADSASDGGGVKGGMPNVNGSEALQE